MSSTLNDTMKTTRHAMESVKEGTEHTFTSALSMLVKGAGAVASVVTALRSFDRDDGLAWFGLARRRRPLRSLALFGAGAAAGAGIALLFAPMSGAELRRAILGGEEELERKAKRTIERAEAEVKEVGKEVGEKAEALVGKAKDAVVKTDGGNHEKRPS